MAVDYQREDYLAALPEWQLVDKAVDEKDLGSFLPTLNDHDTSPENLSRNKFYRDRASWFGASAITVQGLLGVAYEDAPSYELPPVLEYLIENVDGAGVSMDQQMQDVTDQVLRKGRCGLFVTYPEREGDTSVADQRAGNAVATIHKIPAERVINWWTVSDGSSVKLGGVIFTDSETTVTDYEHVTQDTIRALTLEDGVFWDRTWVESSKGEWSVLRQSMPVDGNGKAWSELPFIFVGARSNTDMIDRPPMLSLVKMNRDHYRNSADNEESIWYAGQAQPYLDTSDSAMTSDDLKQAKKDGFYIGSRQLILGRMGFAQADPNTATRQAMLDKLDLMKAMGARFLQAGTVAKTATESAGEQKAQHSILSLIVANVEDAYNSALVFVSQYMKSPEGTVGLSRGFMEPAVTAELIDRVIALLDRAAIGYAEALPILKRANLISDSKDEGEYLEEVEARGGFEGGINDEG